MFKRKIRRLKRRKAMCRIIKIDEASCPQIFDENIDKYLFVNKDKNIIGIATIDDRLGYNRIKINILDEYRGFGYGKALFQLSIEEYKKSHSDKKLIFKVDGNNIFNIILYKFGGVNIDNDNGILEYVLPL